MRKAITVFILSLFLVHFSLAQGILSDLKDKLPKAIQGLELIDTPSIYQNGPDAHMVANYSGGLDTYINITFSPFSAEIFNRLKRDMANAPKAFETDDMKIMAITVQGREGQITLYKSNGKFEGSILDPSHQMLISFTGAGVPDEAVIENILKAILSAI